MVVLASQPSPRQAALKGVKWRFLAAPIEKGQLTEGQTPWTDEARRRIGFLERALASTHDLESQFTSFLSEVAQGDAARGPGQPAGAAAAADSAWGSIRGRALGAMLGGGGGGGGGLDRLDLLAHEPPRADAIPSDPTDALPAAARRAGGAALGARGPPPSALVGGDAAGGPAGADGAHAAEDDEVARVVGLGEADGGARDDNDDERGSPSPVIIWRHAAPVKLAVNVPADLLPASPAAADGAERRARKAAAAAKAGAATAGKAAAAGGGDAAADGGGASPRAAADSFELRRERFGKRMNYGAWYLPVDQWSSRKPHGAADPAALAAQLAGSGIGAGAKPNPEAAAEAAAAAAAAAEVEAAHHEQLPKLYSSRIYKEYLQEKYLKEKEKLASDKRPSPIRIPHYLERVEAPSPTRPAKGGASPQEA